MIKAIYSYPGKWSYDDAYRKKSNLTKDEILYEIKNNQELEKMYQTKCSYISLCGEGV